MFGGVFSWSNVLYERVYPGGDLLIQFVGRDAYKQFWNFSKDEKENLATQLAIELPALRGKVGASQEEIASAVGISRQTYSAYENRTRPIPWSLYLALFTANKKGYYMNKNIKYSQNFLTSEKVLNQIIKQLNLKETDTVYEIGTGKGHLTTKLAKISKQVTSIELDSHLFNLSSEKLKLNTRVTLIHQDILQFQFPNKQRYKIVGSIPYHLSTQIIKKVVFESHASDIYLIVEEGFYKRTLDIHRTLGLLLHTQVSIQQLLKLPAECFHPKPKVNSVLIKLTRHTTDVPDKYWKLYTYFVSKWVNREYRQLFTKNQFHQAMKHAKVNNLSTVTYEQVLSIFNSYLLFNGRK